MALEKIISTHPKQMKLIQELQGYELDLFTPETVNGVMIPVTGMEDEDTIKSVIEDVTATAVKKTTSDFSIHDGRASAHVAFSTVIATDAITINSLTYTGVAGAKSDNTEFSVDTSDTAAAADLVDSINSRDSANVSATADGAGFVVKAATPGAAGNSIAITTSDGTITITTNGTGTLGDGNGDKATGTAQCTSVVAGNTYTLNGKTYTAVADASYTTGEFDTFSVGATPTDTECAANLAAAINGREAQSAAVVATSSTDTVTITAGRLGSWANSIGQAQTGGTITLSGANLTGGTDIGGGFVSNPGATALLAGTGMILWVNKR